MYAILIVVILILIFYFVFFSFQENKNEHFDTYLNHDFAAANLYGTDVPTASLVSRYTWAEKDVDGNNVWDLMYEKFIVDEVYGDNAKQNLKFVLTDKKSQIAPYSLNDMMDPNPVSFSFNGEVITLPQQQY
jgi:hypothetical protein